ncbi:MAG: 2-C-methyl-D-erythritol 4-phosphate cytidylyltransferase [Desulfobacterales bacterium]|jgi:2-C-methyl-D-erythritol 4-phosphate cytidylyltransferase
MNAAIIVAAGKGLRMADPLRKQYLELEGLPILARTVAVFDACDLIDVIFLVIPREDSDYCRANVLDPLSLTKSIHLVSGGIRRQDSVYKGLSEIDQRYQIIVIHDGVRPFLNSDHLVDCIESAKKFGACILGVPAYDTLKRVDSSGRILQTLPRENVWLAQTPQAFQYDVIKKAHDNARRDGYTATDDASLVERMGEKVKIINGSRNNIKITRSEDLEIAKYLLRIS